MHVLEELRKILDDKNEKDIYFGDSEWYKIYRLYNPLSKNFIISRVDKL